MQTERDVLRHTIPDRDLTIVFSQSAHNAMAHDLANRRENALGLCLGGFASGSITVEDSLPIGEFGASAERRTLADHLKPLEDIIAMWLDTPRLPGPVGIYLANCPDLDAFLAAELPGIAKYLKRDVQMIVSVHPNGATAEGEIVVAAAGTDGFARVPVLVELPAASERPRPVFEALTSGGAGAAAAPALKRAPDVETAPAAPPVVPAVPAAVPAPARDPSRTRKRTLRYTLTAVALLFVCAIAWWGYRTQLFRNPLFNRAAATPVATLFDLRVVRAGGDLEVTWNREAPAVRTAQHALLYINDGGQRTQLYLEPSHLKSGRVLYGPRSNDIDFQLEVATADDRLVRESIRVLQAGAPVASTVVENSRPPEQAPATKPTGPPAAPVAESRRVFLPPAGRAVASAAPGSARIDMGDLPRVATQPSLTQRIGNAPAALPPPPPVPSRNVQPQPDTPAANTPAKDDRNVPVPVFQAPAPVPVTVRTLMTQEVVIETLITVDANGRVIEAATAPQDSMVKNLLANIAAEASKRWRFLPATRDGKPVESRYKLIYRFRK